MLAVNSLWYSLQVQEFPRIPSLLSIFSHQEWVLYFVLNVLSVFINKVTWFHPLFY